MVNCVLWDVYRKDHIIYREDLARLRRPSLIIDVSCDRAGAVETSIPTTLLIRFIVSMGFLHYVVDHTPALISYSATRP